ncbi:MAG: transporter [Acidobacteriota bacterium]|nr:transporter [Acidobacteriota bacterium]
MNLLVWRLHRNQVRFAALALAVLAVILLVTGSVMAHDYDRALADCRASQSCADLGSQLFRGDGMIIDLVNLTVVVPLLFGLFWGAPLLAKELEDGTHNLVWTQSVPRRRWFTSTVGWALAAAALWGGAMAALVSWWRYPENALDSRFAAFDIQGIVPVAYALFAVALGIAIGSVARRVLPALAVTIATFLAVRVPIAVYLRPHFLTPVRATTSLASSGLGPPGSWLLSQSLVGPGGATTGNLFSVTPVCTTTGFASKGLIGSCLAHHGYRMTVTYQPAVRFWAFQGIEAGIFVILAALLVVFAFRWTLHRDA